MTQLVGVLCENGDKVILVSDRMVTTANGSLAFEHDPKFEPVSPNVIVLTAGTVHEPELILDVKAQIKGKALVREVAEGLAESYRNIRQKRIEHEILQEVGISSFEEFHRKQNFLHESMVLDLSMRIRDYDLGVALLLGGVDVKAHLYRVGEPGTYRSYDELGFCCIGSGDRHAEPVFAFYGFSMGIDEREAIQIAFEAKKRAEMAGGVGKKTDIWILEKGGIYEVVSETIQELEKSYEQEEKAPRNLGKIEIKRKKVEFAEA